MQSEDIMNDPKRRESTGSEGLEDDEPLEDATDTQVTAQLAAIGGELLEGSGFEEEEQDKEFL